MSLRPHCSVVGADCMVVFYLRSRDMSSTHVALTSLFCGWRGFYRCFVFKIKRHEPDSCRFYLIVLLLEQIVSVFCV